MACDRNKLICAASSAASGIAKVASRTASGVGAGINQAGQWAAENPVEATRLAATLAAIGATVGVYQSKKNTVREETGRLPETKLDVSFQRSGQVPTKQDKALANEINRGMAKVRHQGVALGLGISKVTVADDFAFARNVIEIGRGEYAKGWLGRRALGKVYGAMKPIYVGSLYLNQKASRALAGGTVYAGMGIKGDEVAFSADSFHKDRAIKKMDKKLGGRFAQYTGAVIALRKAPRVRKPRGPFAQTRQAILTDTIARRLVAPDYQGRRNLNELCIRVADWNARRIAEKTGDEPLRILARQLGTR